MDIFRAIENNSLNTVKRLVESGIDINMRRPMTYVTPLCLACTLGRIEIVRFLLENGVNLTKRKNGIAILTACNARCPRPKIVQLLLNYGLDVNYMLKVSKINALHKVCIKHFGMGHVLTDTVIRKKLETIEILVKAGIDINSQNNRGNTALHYAHDDTHIDVVKLLVAKGIDMNIQNIKGHTVLHNVFLRTQEKVVRFLLQAGIDPNIQDELGNTVLHISCIFRKNPKMVKFLLRTKIDVNRQNKLGDTALSCACSSKLSSLAIVKILLDFGVNIDIRNNNGNNALHGACLKGRRRTIKLLLEYGISVSELDKEYKEKYKTDISIGIGRQRLLVRCLRYVKDNMDKIDITKIKILPFDIRRHFQALIY